MLTYLCVYIGSLLLAVLLTPILIYIAHVFKIYDSLDMRKVHASSIPRIGGIAIFLSATTLVIAVSLLDNGIGEALRRLQIQAVTLLATSTFIFLIGLIDDLYGIRARHKLLAQVTAASALCLSGIQISSLNFVNLFTLHFGWISFPITVFWIVAITNAVNLIDGLDGLAAGISAVTCAVIALFSFNSNQPIMVVLMLALLGSLSGFLFFNFNPARIFMGDCGSMFLGFFMASASIICMMKSGTIVALALPALALGLPIFDTIFVMLRRFLRPWGIMSPDRSHLHYRLLDMGFRHRHVVVAMYAITAIAAGLGMFMMLTHAAGTIGILLCVLLLLVLFFRAAGAVRFRETIAGLKQKRAVSHQQRQEVMSFEEAELRFRRAKIFNQWWQAVCFAADKLDIAGGSLPLTNRDGTKQVLAWGKDGNDTAAHDIVTVSLPVRDRRTGLPLKLEIDIHANGSLESAGRRTTLFARLIEEHSIANLSNEDKKTLTADFRAAEQPPAINS